MIWETLTSKIGTFLNDSSLQSYPDALRILAWNKACEYFAVTHTAKIVVATATGNTFLDGKLVEFPSDLIQLSGVELPGNKGRWLEQNFLIPGTYLPDEGYMEMGGGIYIPKNTDSSSQPSTYRLWYYAKFSDVVDGNSEIETPLWAEWALMQLSMAYLLTPDMMNQQNLRQFQTRREAGDPEDNPPRKQAQFYIGQYTSVVSVRKPQDREINFRSGAR